jgi:phenylpropionate dioxygenase-like ring-hydroxylating dioxygenase large terminal subunit
MVYARNEEEGLRCIYHGWKFDTNGYCVDMPNEPAESAFKEKVRCQTYATQEAAGIVWIYMGPKNLKPEMPDRDWMRYAPEQRNIAKFNLEGNWVQAMEGDVDSSHVGFLHKTLADLRNPSSPEARYQAGDKAPKWTIQPTNYGMMIAARRNASDDTYYWRINQVMLPYYTLVAGALDQNCFFMHMWVPTDDVNTDVWTVMWRIHRPMNAEEREAMFTGPYAHVASYNPETHALNGNHKNRFFQDRQVLKTQTFSGIPGIREQDAAMTVGMGPIVDRTKEHLGTADAAVIATRRILIKAARSLQQGEEPHAPYHGDCYRPRAWSGLLKKNEDFLNDPLVRQMELSTVP